MRNTHTHTHAESTLCSAEMLKPKGSPLSLFHSLRPSESRIWPVASLGPHLKGLECAKRAVPQAAVGRVVAPAASGTQVIHYTRGTVPHDHRQCSKLRGGSLTPLPCQLHLAGSRLESHLTKAWCMWWSLALKTSKGRARLLSGSLGQSRVVSGSLQHVEGARSKRSCSSTDIQPASVKNQRLAGRLRRRGEG